MFFAGFVLFCPTENVLVVLRALNSGLTREGRAGLFKFVFSMLEGRSPRLLPRQELETFVRRLRPDLTEVCAGYVFLGFVSCLLS